MASGRACHERGTGPERIAVPMRSRPLMNALPKKLRPDAIAEVFSLLAARVATQGQGHAKRRRVNQLTNEKPGHGVKR